MINVILNGACGRLGTTFWKVAKEATDVNIVAGVDVNRTGISTGFPLYKNIKNVAVVLVVDATTGQNGLNQAREFNDALDLDGLIVTKLDGTAKGGIALAISSQLSLPIYRIGVGESIDDLQSFDALEFCRALVGEGM